MTNTRRKFLQQLAIGTSALVMPFTAVALDKRAALKRIKFGIIADPHKDLTPDADKRLDAFMERAADENPDFIINLGDFCFSKEKNRPFFKRFDQFKGPKYHVLGNHDMDYNTKEEAIGFLEMEGNYYSFDHKGFHFVVLDANYLYQDGKYIDYQHANFYVDDTYRTFINDEQIEWFKADLKATAKPVIVFSHQSLLNYASGVKNRMELQQIMEQANQEAGHQKVLACFNGHDHIDFYREVNGIHYFEINSMSYQWLGGQYKNYDRYDEQLYKQYPNLANMAPYKDALYAFVTIEPEGYLQVQGVQSEWVPPSPYDTGMPKGLYGNRISPVISDYKVGIQHFLTQKNKTR